MRCAALAKHFISEDTLETSMSFNRPSRCPSVSTAAIPLLLKPSNRLSPAIARIAQSRSEVRLFDTGVVRFIVLMRVDDDDNDDDDVVVDDGDVVDEEFRVLKEVK